ncbi:MAG: hypothetical protein LAP39_02480 [Acidobacteriia bacterium]|nr:hypothetical protein [Terriglobia bacterium]
MAYLVLLDRLLCRLLDVYASTVGALSPLLSLALLAAVAGVGMLWLIGKLSKQNAVRITRRQIQATLLEFRLFWDEPRVVWRAQTRLLRLNGRYLMLMLPPVLIGAIPVAFLMIRMEGLYGRAPLPIAQPAIVTVQLAGPINEQAAPPRLDAPPQVSVETPALRAFRDNQVCWRIRPLAATSGALRLFIDGEVIEKNIAAGGSWSYLSDRRSSSASELFWHPGEPRLQKRRVVWVEVQYPTAYWGPGRFQMHWIWWFLVFSMLGGLLLKRRLGVHF